MERDSPKQMLSPTRSPRNLRLRHAAGAPAAGTASEQSDGERRPVTVVFADLVDYTRMSRALDPEDVHAMLERFYEAADGIVERFGGSIDKHIGDSVMAVFGAPVAHGDDAIRAVRAAAEIHRAMPALDGAAGQPLAVHIGIASGEVVASGLGRARHRAYTVIGNSVNLAARLLKLAGAGETVLDEAVHAAAQGIARCAPIEAAKVKGIDMPLDGVAFHRFRRRSRPRGTAPVRRTCGGACTALGVARELRGGWYRRHRVSCAATPASANRGSSANCAAGPWLQVSLAIPDSCWISAWRKDARWSAKSS